MHLKSSHACGQKLSSVPGATLFLQAYQDVQIGTRSSASQFQYTLQSDNVAELEEVGAEGNRIDATAFRICATFQPTNRIGRYRKATLVVDRDTASRLGISEQVIDNTLYDAFGQRQVSTIYTQLNQYHVVLEVDPRFPAEHRCHPSNFMCALPKKRDTSAAEHIHPF